MFTYDVIVIGGGASGMTAAICAARNGNQVLLLEKNAKLGRKIAASGNGKCNLTNANISTEFYHEASYELERILSLADCGTVLEFMRGIGIFCKEKRGYYYPVCEQAAVVVQLLQAELEHLNVNILFEERVDRVVLESNNSFLVYTENNSFHGKNVILASGGMAAPKLGAEGTGYAILNKLGHTVADTVPALVQLTAKERFLKKISGVRTEAEICLSIDNGKYNEKGEIIFTDQGISGIPVFQISRYVTEPLNAGRHVQLSINLLPNLETDDVRKQIMTLLHYNPKLPFEYLFRSFCNNKLVYALICDEGLDAERPCAQVKEADVDKMLRRFQNCVFQITGTNGFEFAQVTRGGVSLEEINPDTMESKLVPGLYITGELLDVDGICGGYNLHFAWASGILAGSSCR